MNIYEHLMNMHFASAGERALANYPLAPKNIHII